MVNKKLSKLLSFQTFIIKSWWVILFSLLCLMLYERGQKNNRVLLNKLKARTEELKREKLVAEKTNRELQMTINSQSDPAFVELTLMKVLGVVSQGQTKIIFMEQR